MSKDNIQKQLCEMQTRTMRLQIFVEALEDAGTMPDKEQLDHIAKEAEDLKSLVTRTEQTCAEHGIPPQKPTASVQTHATASAGDRRLWT